LPDFIRCYLRFSGVCLFLISISIFSSDTTTTKESRKIPVPPLANGGIAGLWYPEHEYIQKKYGDFELLNFSNAGYDIPKDSNSTKPWKLTALGNFLPGTSVQYAALARLAQHDDGLLLIMFEWVDPTHSPKSHGVFYDSFIGKQSLVIRTRQGFNGGVDTLEFSCTDLDRLCGQAYYDSTGTFEFNVLDTD